MVRQSENRLRLHGKAFADELLHTLLCVLGSNTVVFRLTARGLIAEQPFSPVAFLLMV
jgi:hypothetical protein